MPDSWYITVSYDVQDGPRVFVAAMERAENQTSFSIYGTRWVYSSSAFSMLHFALPLKPTFCLLIVPYGSVCDRAKVFRPMVAVPAVNFAISNVHGS